MTARTIATGALACAVGFELSRRMMMGSSGLFAVLALGLALTVFALRASPANLLRAAAGASVVPWSLAGVGGVPQKVAEMPISLYVIWFALTLLVAQGALRPRRGGASVRMPAPVLWLAVSTMLLVLSTVASGSIAAALPWITGCVLVLAIAAGVTTEVLDPRSVLRTVVTVQALVATWDVAQNAIGMRPLPSLVTQTALVIENGVTVSRFAGTLGDYELYSEINSLCLAAAIGLMLTGSRVERGRWLLTAVPLAVAVLASGTRGGIIVLGVALAVFCVLRRAWRHLVFVGLLGLLLAVFGQGLTTIERLGSIGSGQGFSRLINRESAWRLFLERTQDDLWSAFGHGLAYPYEVIGGFPHSLGLYLLYAGGVVGGGFFLVGLGWFAVQAVRTSWRGTAGGAIAASLVVAAIVDQSKIEFVRLDAYVIAFYGILAVVAGFVAAAPEPEVERPIESQVVTV